MTTTNTLSEAPRQTLRDKVEQRIIGAKQEDFLKWLYGQSIRPGQGGEGLDFIPNRQIATTMLSVYIERTLPAREGVWFGTPESIRLPIVNSETGKERILQIDAPQWMTDFILSFDNAPWAAL
jgi:hypothetical protein